MQLHFLQLLVSLSEHLLEEESTLRELGQQLAVGNAGEGASCGVSDNLGVFSAFLFNAGHEQGSFPKKHNVFHFAF